METDEIWSEKSEVFIKYEAEVSSRMGGGERGVVVDVTNTHERTHDDDAKYEYQ